MYKLLILLSVEGCIRTHIPTILIKKLYPPDFYRSENYYDGNEETKVREHRKREIFK